MALRVADVAEPPDRGLDLESNEAPLIAVGRISDADESALQDATFTLTEEPTEDPRAVTVTSIDAALAELRTRIDRWPNAAAVCDDVLRSVAVAGTVAAGLIVESLGYSTLQSGPEFARWLTERGAVEFEEVPDPLLVDRDGSRLSLTFNRPRRHNAFSNATRQELVESLLVAEADPTIDTVVLRGNGPSFCSGGDLAEFGTFTDPASAHLARTRHSPARRLAAVTARLGASCRAEIHGQVLGSGLEMAAFCGKVTCSTDAVLALPELRLGLIPGAGGTVSITRRIGRWRTAYLILSGQAIDPRTALSWGLVDAVE